MKYYAVKSGRVPGIYNSWEDCKEQTDKYKGAIFKSFSDPAEANEFMFGNEKSDDSIRYEIESINCDGSYSSSTGIMEFNVKDTKTGELLINKSYFSGTNNLAEFLAVVNAIEYLKQNNLRKKIIYTDSVTAMAWVRDKTVNTNFDTTLDFNLENDIKEALEYLQKEPSYNYTIKKWDTINWGEIPSDFGRK